MVLTSYDGDVQAVRAIKAGATGYLLKSILRAEIIDAVHDVRRGRRHIHPGVANEIAPHVGSESLSEREVAVLRLVAVWWPGTWASPRRP